MNKTIDIANRYKKIIDWETFFNIVYQLGDKCNGRKDRFDKADIFEQAIEICSNNKLKWIDGIGRDHRDIEYELDIEFKYQNQCMFYKNLKKKNVVKIKIKNSLGKTKNKTIENPADYYMFSQENAVGIISYKEMESYLNIVGDGLSTEIPHDKITIIVPPHKINIFNNIKCIDYKAKKREMQRQFIMSIKQN